VEAGVAEGVLELLEKLSKSVVEVVLVVLVLLLRCLVKVIILSLWRLAVLC